MVSRCRGGHRGPEADAPINSTSRTPKFIYISVPAHVMSLYMNPGRDFDGTTSESQLPNLDRPVEHAP